MMTVLIVGGSYQGKKDFASRQFGLNDCDFYECGNTHIHGPENYTAVNKLHLWVKAALETGEKQEQILEKCVKLFSGKVICCDDISCGIVPLDPVQREWREVTGRCLCALARRAELVLRIHCGLPQILKGCLEDVQC